MKKQGRPKMLSEYIQALEIRIPRLSKQGVETLKRKGFIRKDGSLDRTVASMCSIDELTQVLKNLGE